MRRVHGEIETLLLYAAGQIDLTIRKNVTFRVTIPAGYPKSPPSAKCLNVSDVKSERISAAVST